MNVKKKPIMFAVVAIDIVTAVLAWRDLERRDNAAVRGGKRLWQTAIIANPGNSLAYWAFARR